VKAHRVYIRRSDVTVINAHDTISTS